MKTNTISAYERQRNIVRKLRSRLIASEKRNLGLISVPGKDLSEKIQNDNSVKNLFGGLRQLLDGAKNDEAAATFLLNQVGDESFYLLELVSTCYLK